MKFSVKFLFVAFLSSAHFADKALACDLCAIYNSVDSQKPRENTFRLGLTEQFTGYDKIQQDGHYVANSMQQHLESSISQLFGAYDFSNSFGIQVSLPYINRRFKRVNDGMAQTGTEAGIGDMTILGRYLPYQFRKGDNFFNVQLLAGVKLPTGDTDRLKEELSEDHQHESAPQEQVHNEMSNIMRHDQQESDAHTEMDITSAVHGHDLALGSGSVDYPVGISLFAEKGRFFAKGSAIYSIRTSGDHDYQYADDLMWDFGPGYYFYLQPKTNIATRVVLSGERKSKDSGRNGEIQQDTGINSFFIGPEIDFMASNTFSGDIALDLPVDIDNSGLQAVAKYRLRAGFTLRF